MSGGSPGNTGKGEGAPRGHVFISYDPSDLAVATQIGQHLEQSGFPCFLAGRDLDAPQDGPDATSRAIEMASCVVLVLSHHSNRSETVRNEIAAAYRQGKPIFPMRVEETLPSPQLELFISAKHWIDAWKGTLSQHTAHLARELSGGTSLIGSAPGLPWYRQRLWQHTGLTLATVALAAIAISYWMTSGLRQQLEAAYPALVSFTGGYIIAGKSNEVSFSVQDAHRAGGATALGALAHLSEFEIYNVTDLDAPVLVYKASRDTFAGKYGTSFRNKLSFDVLPAILVSCLSYPREEEGDTETVLQAFGFMAAGSAYGHKKFDAVRLADRHLIHDETPAPCRELALAYAGEEVDRAMFERRVREAANRPDSPPQPVQPQQPPTPPAPLSERENIVGTLVMAQAFNKSYCRGKAFTVNPDTEGVAMFKAKHQITDAEIEASTARWEPTYARLDEQVQGESCITYLENYVAHRLLIRASSVPLTRP